MTVCVRAYKEEPTFSPPLHDSVRAIQASALHPERNRGRSDAPLYEKALTIAKQNSEGVWPLAKVRTNGRAFE